MEKNRLEAFSDGVLAIIILATVLGGFCPIAAFIVVAIVSCWWIVPEKKRQ